MNTKTEWIPIGKVSDFSQEKKTPVKPGDEEVLIFKVDQKWHAIQKKCPHQDRPLDDARIKDGKVSCIFHAVEFDLNTGQIVFDEGYMSLPNLKVYPVKVEKDQLLVKSRPKTLESWDQGLEF